MAPAVTAISVGLVMMILSVSAIVPMIRYFDRFWSTWPTGIVAMEKYGGPSPVLRNWKWHRNGMVRQSPSRTSPHSSKRILLQTLCTALRARFRAPLRIRSRKDLRLNSQDSLWHFNTGQAMHASPMSYAVDRIQFVVIAAGSDVFRLLASPL